MRWLGIDVGGTFTDLVLYDEESGAVVLEKVPSTPHDHSEGMIGGIERLRVDLGSVSKIAHGTTVATNTALERNGAKMAVLMTRGFRDVIEVGRGNRTMLYDIKGTRPPPLIPRSLCFEIDERTAFDGTVLRPVRREDVEAVADRLAVAGVEAAVVCFLHSYADASNEQEAKAILTRRAPGLFVSTSSEVLPEFREYERFSTAALNVYVAPRMRRYLTALERKLSDRGYRHPVAIMTSSGGTMPVSRAIELPVQTMLSGPAAGVIGASYICKQAGYPDCITYDMGGTSTDVCLISNHAFDMSTEGRIEALPNKVLQIEINSIGAGGGSIASIDHGGFLNVGPRSAGAMPGPACYGRGGTEPTVTDANVVLGRLGTARRLGGEITLGLEKAQVTVEGLARALKLDPLAMAEGIVKLAAVKMTGAIKEISVMRGHDPRGYALFAFGGAGPLHAALVADELGMRRVLVPPMPGNFSAFGLLAADVRHNIVQTRLLRLDGLAFETIADALASLRVRARKLLGEEGFADMEMRFEASLDMRYIGQAFELSVPLPDDVRSVDEIERAFRQVYEKRYAYAASAPAEIVNFRLAAYGLTRKPNLPRAAGGGTVNAALVGRRPVAFGGAFAETPIYDRDKLPVGDKINGPAIVEEANSTTVVPPAFRAEVDPHGNLILTRE